jgi:hypothetical protein
MDLNSERQGLQGSDLRRVLVHGVGQFASTIAGNSHVYACRSIAQDFKRNCTGEPVRVVIEHDGPREPVRLYPGSGGAENEGLGHTAL